MFGCDVGQNMNDLQFSSASDGEQLQFRPIKFEKISQSWVALHPRPKGVIQFVGGAFYGTAPTWHYRYFLSALFDAGYTIIALPFRFTFHHWNVALDLLEEHHQVRQAILSSLLRESSRSRDYAFYTNAANYTWVGHSLGCKYVILLEILNDGWAKFSDQAAEVGIEKAQLDTIQSHLMRVAQVRDQLNEPRPTDRSAPSINSELPSIHNQAAILIAPVIADLTAAIPLRSLQRGCELMGLKIFPTVEQTYDLIAHSHSFNLLQILQFQHDLVAKPTCDRLVPGLKSPVGKALATAAITGKHLEPIGFRIGSYIVDFNPLDKFIGYWHSRQLEAIVLKTLIALQQQPVLQRLGSTN
jgi:Protein of unknown function (DUF1350)